MKYFAILLLLVCGVCKAATGDILPGTVETNGNIIEIIVAGKNVPASGEYTNSNDGFAFGFLTNNSGLSTVKLTLTSLGYTTAGASTTVQRTLYGTHQLRKPYPSQTNNDVTASGSDALIRVALSDYVYTSDSNLSLTIGSGWWSNNNAVASLAITNASTQVWPDAGAAWSIVPGQQVSNSFTLSAVAFHRSAPFQNTGKPVQAVRFRSKSATAASTNFATLVKTTGALSGMTVCEYSLTVDGTIFTQGELITNNIDVYPYCGDRVYSSDTGVSPNLCPLVFLCDKAGTFCPNIALVDPATGDDTNGRITNGNPVNVLAGHYFKTLDGAAKQGTATNQLANGHNDPEGLNIWVRSSVVGQTNYWVGGSSSYGTLGGKTFIYINRYPTNVLGDVIIAQQTGNQRLGAAGSKVKISGIMITNGPNIFGQGDLWFDQCVFNSSSGTVFQRATNVYVTSSYVTNLNQGLIAGGDIAQVVLIRDNVFTGLTKSIMAYNLIGNYKGGKTTPSQSLFKFSSFAAGNANSLYPLLAFNYWGGWVMGGSDLFQYTLSLTASNITLVQNVFENTSSSSSGALCSIANDSSTVDQPNVIKWYSTDNGERSSMGYNWTPDSGSGSGTTPLYRKNWSIVNNLVANFNIKGDTEPLKDGSRIGYFDSLYGAGWVGNASLQITNVGAAFSFGWEFQGLNSYQPPITRPNGYPTGTPNVSTYAAFISDGSKSGTGNGNGDYHLQSQSPVLVNIQTSWVLPYDLDGVFRGNFDPPGAYASASPRKGSFFAQ